MRSGKVGDAAGAPPVLDGEELLVRLRAALPDGARITGLRRLGDGHSNDTYLLKGLDLLLRAAPAGPGLMPDYDIPHQFRVLRAVGQAAGAPPVPRVSGLCTDQAVIGRSFFLMERRPGSSTDWNPPDWLREGPDALRATLSRRWIGAIAAVHGLDTGVVGRMPCTPGDEAGRWLDLARNARGPSRLLTILEDLAGDPPASSGPATCVHGDVKFANLLWTPDGELTAMLDWEFAHVGEPLTDLGYLLGLWPAEPGEPGQMPFTRLDGWWDRERFIAGWQELTGRSAVGVERHEDLGMAKIGVIFALGIDLYRSGRSTDPRLARWERSLEVWLDSIERRRRRRC